MPRNPRMLLRIVSVILLVDSIAMLPALICAVYYGERGPASAFFFTALVCTGISMLIRRFFPSRGERVHHNESYFIAFFAWFLVCLIGTLPFALSESGYSLADCIFESVSGWTTTGAVTIPLDVLPRSLILWKGISNWLGGMGLLLLAVSFFPVLGVEGQKMAAAEMPGPELEKMSARVSDTAKITYRIYIVLTVAEFLLLLPSTLTPFEALTNTMSTISTAGLLSPDPTALINASPYVQAVCTVFTLAGSINFMIYFFLYNRKWRQALRSVELRTYLALLAGGAVLIAGSLVLSGRYPSFLAALGDSVTQAAAFGATSGYEVDTINLWPTFSKMILLILLFIGGCANSTSGSIKVIRFIVFVKLIFRGIYKRIHPRAIKPIMLHGRPVSAAMASSVTVFLLLYFLVFLMGSFLLSLENLDLETTLSTTLACITNNGTAFGAIAGGDFAILSEGGKLIASLLMLAGRLELYAIVLLFSPSFWNPDRASA